MLLLPAVVEVLSSAVPIVMLSANTLIGPAILVTLAVDVVVAPVSDSLFRVTEPPDCAVAPSLSRPTVKLVMSVLSCSDDVSKAVVKLEP